MLNTDVYTILSIFKTMRKKVIDDFKNQEVEIFSPSFKYEKMPISLNVAIDKYFISWLNSHYDCFDEILNALDCDENTKESLKNIFIDMYLKLTYSFTETKPTVESNEITRELLRKKAETLKELLKVSDLSDAKFNRVKYEYQRDKVLFDRKMEELEREAND